MTTERDLIYTIWEIIRAGLPNQDDSINERLMRQFLTIHRGKSLSTAYNKGATIDEECFQNIGDLKFNFVDDKYISTELDKVIRFPYSYGLMFDKDGFTIPILNSLEFHNSQKDRFNKFTPKLKLIGRKLELYLGKEIESNQIEDLSNSDLNITVKKLANEAKFGSIELNGFAIFVNPDSEPDYDWTSTPYPMPDVLIENLINSVNAREFNIFLKMKSDETGDLRNNMSEYGTREEL